MRLSLQKMIASLLVVSLLTTLISVPGYGIKEADASTTTYYAIKASNSKYVTVGSDKVLYANSSSVGNAAQWFELVSINGGSTYYLKSKQTGYYVGYPSSDPRTLTADKSSSDSNLAIATLSSETLTIKISYTSKNKTITRYAEVSSSNTLVASSDSAVNFYHATKVSRILEVTDSGTSDLQSIIGYKANYLLDTMSMKRFVALRGELDGKYDAIYIGKGFYNPSKLGLLTTTSTRTAGHKTVNMTNDITALKANEIIDDFINKGQLVFLYSDSSANSSKGSGLLYQAQVDQQTGSFLSYSQGILYNSFFRYSQNATKKSNVIFLTSTTLSNLATTLSGTAYSNLLNQDPKLIIDSKPVDYTTDASTIYRAGDTITFNFTVPNSSNFTSGNVAANLYLGLDSAKAFSADQVVASTTVSGTSGTVSYTLPKGYSGLYYWKLELVDQSSKLKSYETGVFRYRDQVTNVRVLQVTHDKSMVSSLNRAANLTQSYLSSNDYKISINVVSMEAFNSTEYRNLNGNYDMLIFGFRDNYNTASTLSTTAAAAVTSFINTGQSVMFTHDTIYNSEPWLTSFQAATGQITPRTEIGRGANNPSTTVAQVNSGLLTEFPFNLENSTPSVATTHDQYWTLDLEDENVTPWYNMTSASGDTYQRDPNDSWYHYYTYSKGNVTYSGTGHIFYDSTLTDAFPDWEEKLFVNTMYRAYMGSNHAPTVTVYSPTDYSSTTDNFIPSYQDISLSFMPEDYDFADRKLNVDVKVIVNGTTVSSSSFTQSDAVSGSTITKTIANPLPDGGNFSIQITVTDSTGAQVTKTIPITVKKISSYLTLNRTTSDLMTNNRLEKNATATLNYTATPKAIASSTALNASSLVIRDISFSEKLPAGLEITSLPSGMTRSGTVTTGYTVSGTFTNIAYSLSGSNYVASPISFAIGVKPVQNGAFTLNSSTLTYKDVGETDSMTLPFPTISFDAITKLTSLSISGTEVAKGDQYLMIPTYAPSDATSPSFSWTSSNTNVATINASTGLLTAVATGTTTITVVDAITGKSATATVTVIERGLSITGSDTVPVGGTIELTGRLLIPTYESTVSSSLQWTQATGTGSATLAASTDIWKRQLSGTTAGTVNVTLTVNTLDSLTEEIKTYTVTKTITVTPKITNISLANAQIAVGDQLTMVPTVTPSTADKSFLTFTSSNASVASISSTSGLLTANAVGTATITVTDANSGVNATATVTVIDRTLTLAGNDTVNFNSTTNLTGTLTKPSYESVQTVAWTSSNSAIATVAASASNNMIGVVTGVASGTVTITLTVTTTNTLTNTTRTYTATKEITVSRKLTSLSLSDAQVAVGDTFTMSPIYTPTSGASFTTAYTSSNTSVATINAMTGVLTAITPGTTTITVTDSISGLSAPATVTVIARALTITGNSSVFVGDKLDLTGTLTKPSYETIVSNGITWTSSDTTKATVSANTSNTMNGVVTGVAPGTVTITQTIKTTNTITGAERTYTETKDIAINQKLTNLTLSDAQVAVGDTYTMIPVRTPATANSYSLTYTSSNTDIASIDSSTGVLTAKAAGTTTITVRDNISGLSTTATVTVITRDHSILGNDIVDTGKAISLTGILTLPPYETIVSSSWSSSNPAIATIAATTGNTMRSEVNGIAGGVITVMHTVTTRNSLTNTSKTYTLTKDITVRQLVTALTLDNVTVAVGDQYPMAAAYTPANADVSQLTYTSSNPAIATINAGTGSVTAIANGTTTITVKDALSGESATATVTVITRGLAITGSNIVNVGDSIQLAGTLTKPSYETLVNSTWTSSVPTIGRANAASGDPMKSDVTGVASGAITVKQTVTTSNSLTNSTNTYTQEMVITVKQPLTAITISDVQVAAGDQYPMEAALVPATADTYLLTYTSSNTAVATIDPSTGSLTAVREGTTTITVRDATTGLSDTATVTVITRKLVITGDDAVIIGDTILLTGTLTKASYETLISSSWQSSNILRATASKNTNDSMKGNILGILPGAVTITQTVTTKNNLTNATVTYTETKVVTVGQPSLKLSGLTQIGVGDVLPLTAQLVSSATSILDSTGLIESVSWSGAGSLGSMPSSSGTSLTNQLKATAAGSTTITATVKLVGDITLTASLPITILDRALSISSVNDKLPAGGSVIPSLDWIKDAGKPSWASNYLPTWGAEDSTINGIVVDKTTGKVTAPKGTAGEFTLVAAVQSPAGKVFEVAKTVTIVNLTSVTVTLDAGSTKDLKDYIQIYPLNVASGLLSQLTFPTINTGVAAVTATGKVTGIKQGTTTVSVTLPALGITLKLTIVVKNKDKY